MVNYEFKLEHVVTLEILEFKVKADHASAAIGKIYDGKVKFPQQHPDFPLDPTRMKLQPIKAEGNLKVIRLSRPGRDYPEMVGNRYND